MAITSTRGSVMSRLAATTVGTVDAASTMVGDDDIVPTSTSPSTRSSRKPCEQGVVGASVHPTVGQQRAQALLVQDGRQARPGSR